ncbi:MAG TPA: methylglyoxal synthase [Anaerolineales bacterium]|nr:methylglyoxal synthase [Anaerolineales bacterium]
MKVIALIAHDGKKADMVAWATYNRDALARHQLVATEATARLLREKVGLEVEAVQPGPQGGDAQIGARVVEGQVDGVRGSRNAVASAVKRLLVAILDVSTELERIGDYAKGIARISLMIG